MVMATKTPQGARLNPQNTLELSQGMSIQTALNTADAHGGFWVILLYPSTTYNEGDLTTTGGALITIRGMDEHVMIAPAIAPAVAVINITETLYLENITIIAPDATRPAVLVNTAAGAPTITDCSIIGVGAGYSLQMTQGSVDVHRGSFSGDVHLSTARCLMDCFFTTFLGDLITAAEALNHDIDLMSCEFTGGNITSLATGATVIAIEGGSDIDAITNSGTGLFTITGSYVDSVSCLNAGGEIRVRGGTLNSITRAVGAVVWWQDDNTLKVIPSGTTTDTVIQWAIAAATAGDVVLIHPGTYAEPIACKAGVDLKGVGPASGVIITQVNADIITLATNVHLDNLTIRLGTPDAERHLIEDNAVACTARMSNLILEITAPTNIANLMVFYFTGAGDYTIERCSFSITYTGNAVGHGVHTSTNAATLHLVDNDFTYLVNNAAIHIFCSVASTITGSGNTWAGTAIMFETSNGTITLDHDALTCTAGWTVTGTTIVLRHCPIEAPVVAGNLATVRMKNCSYRAIQRTGTGNIVDESPDLKDAPWHVQRWSWMATLAQSQVSVRGTPVDAGTGQVLLQVVDSVVDVEAVESGTEAAGALSNKLTPARTPRFITQIVVDSFDAEVTMFFGLRETLGDAVPAATEDHAGFIWDGTNFKSSSDDGVGIQENNLAEPSTDTLHQLEVIVFGGVTTVGWVEFYVDGLLVQTHVTRIPVNDLDWQHLLPTAGGGLGDAIDVTVRGGGVQQCPV